MEQKDPTVIVPVSMKLSQKEKIKKKAVEQHRTVSSFMTVKALDIVNFQKMYTEQLTIKLSKKDREIAKENAEKVALPVSSYLRLLIAKGLRNDV